MINPDYLLSPALPKVRPITYSPGSDQEGTEKWPYAGTAGAINAMGGKHVVTDVSEAHVDTKNKVNVVLLGYYV